MLSIENCLQARLKEHYMVKRVIWSLINIYMGHLNGYFARGGGNLKANFPKIQMPGGWMLKLRFDRYVSDLHETCKLDTQNSTITQNLNSLNSLNDATLSFTKLNLRFHCQLSSYFRRQRCT